MNTNSIAQEGGLHGQRSKHHDLPNHMKSEMALRFFFIFQQNKHQKDTKPDEKEHARSSPHIIRNAKITSQK